MNSLFRRHSLQSSLIRLSSLFLLTCLIGFSGCEEDAKPTKNVQSEVIAYPGQTVTLLIPESETTHFRWEVVLEEWEAQTLGETQVVTYENTQTLLEILQDEANRANTIVFLPRQDFAEVGSAKVLEEIPESLRGADDFNWNDLYDSLRKSSLTWDGNPTALPVREPILLLYYRRDLLEAAGLNPPRNWQEYRQLLTTLDQWAPELSAVEPWHPGFRSDMYLTHALPYVSTKGNYSVFFDYSSGKPLIDTPGFVRGIEQSREILKLLDAGSTEMSPQDCLNAIRNGQAALAIAPAFSTSEAMTARQEEQPSEHYPIATVAIPGATTIFDAGRDTWRDLNNQTNRAALCGWDGLLVGVAKGKQSESEAAWNLLRSIMITYPQDSFVPGTMTSTRLSTSTQIWSPLFEDLDERSHVDAVRETLKDARLVPALTVAHRDEFLGELNATVNRLIFEDPDSDAAAGLQELAAKWSALMEQHGQKETRLSYARTLGIPINR